MTKSAPPNLEGYCPKCGELLELIERDVVHRYYVYNPSLEIWEDSDNSQVNTSLSSDFKCTKCNFFKHNNTMRPQDKRALRRFINGAPLK